MPVLVHWTPWHVWHCGSRGICTMKKPANCARALQTRVHSRLNGAKERSCEGRGAQQTRPGAGRQGPRLQQREGQDGVKVVAQVRGQLVRPRQAQQQVGGHEVVVHGPPEQQLALQRRLPQPAAALACPRSPVISSDGTQSRMHVALRLRSSTGSFSPQHHAPAAACKYQNDGVNWCKASGALRRGSCSPQQHSPATRIGNPLQHSPTPGV